MSTTKKFKVGDVVAVSDKAINEDSFNAYYTNKPCTIKKIEKLNASDSLIRFEEHPFVCSGEFIYRISKLHKVLK